MLKGSKQKKVLDKLIGYYDKIQAFVESGQISRQSPMLSLIRYLCVDIRQGSLAFKELIDTAICAYQELKNDFHLDDPEHHLARYVVQ